MGNDDRIGFGQGANDNMGRTGMTISRPTLGAGDTDFLVAATRDLSALDPAARASIPDPKSMAEFLEAPELAALGEALRARHGLPTEPSVRFLWKRKGGKKYGACVKPSGLAAHFGRADFVVWLAADNCRGFTNHRVEALLHHELLHTGADPETLEPILIDHDAELFLVELERYGAWHPGWRGEFGGGPRQLALAGVDPGDAVPRRPVEDGRTGRGRTG